MKNISIKVEILICSCAIAITAIVAFIITKAKAPELPEVKNLHKIALAEAINKFDTSAKESHNEEVYLEVNDKFRLYRSEEFLVEYELDSLKVPFMTTYVPIFTAACNTKFGPGEWSFDDHKAMKSRMTSLKKNYSSALTEDHTDEFSRINGIISKYSEAWKFAGNTKYSSNENARTAINKSGDYLNTSPINNCSKLTKRLRAMPNAIGKSHYNHVLSLVKALGNYRDMSQEAWGEKHTKAYKAIGLDDDDDGYMQIRSMYNFNYNEYTVESLTEKFNQLQDEAINYYSNYKTEPEPSYYY